jgi:hypothetical protein
MKKTVFTLIIGLTLSGLSFGQLTGIKNIPGDYASVAAAISALNAQGVGPGGVTFNVAAGHTEIFSSVTDGLITTTTSSESNPVVFQKTGIGTNPLITGFGTAPGTADYIICIAGADYITFDGIDVKESSGVLEWGYAILKASATNGSQHITIKNCAITLNKTNSNTVGIYSNNVTPTAPTTQLTITAFSGSNSYNKFFSNVISDMHSGIYLLGYNDPASPWGFYDQGNEIGKDGANTITNLGSGSAVKYGINTSYQNNLTLANNQFIGNIGGTGNCTVMNLSSASNATVNIYYNLISLQYAGTGTFYGIYCNMGSTVVDNTISINNNQITGCTFPAAVAASCYYLYNATYARTTNVYNNQVTNNTYGSTSTTGIGSLYYIYQFGSSSVGTVDSYNVYGNTISGNARLQSTPGSGSTYYLYVSGSATIATGNIYNNTVENNTSAATGTTYLLYTLTGPSVKNVYNNTVASLNNARGLVYGLYQGNGYSINIYRNKVVNIHTITNTGQIYGIYLGGSSQNAQLMLYNNFIGDLKATASTSSSAICGIYNSPTSTTRVGLYNNTVYLDGTSTGTGFGTQGMYVGTNPIVVDLRNNIIVNNTIPTGTGTAVALRWGASGFPNMDPGSNNNNYYTGSGAMQFLFSDGTYADQSISSYRARAYPMETQSLSELPPFVNTTTSPYDLHINQAITTQCESAGTIISTPVAITTDFDNDPRYPNPGYPDNPSYPAVAPDLGADEFGGIPTDQTPPAILFPPLMNTSSLLERTLTATIKDMHGVPVTGAGCPRLYWKKHYTGLWNSVTGTSIGNNKYTFTFGSGVSLNDTVYYYIAAQDGFTVPAVGTYPILGAGGFSANPPASSTPPSSPSFYKIIQGICGTFNVGAGQPYLTLTEAVNDLNSKELTCPVTLVLTDNTYSSETYPIIINNIPGSSEVNTLTIKPGPGKTPVISGNFTGVSPNPWAMISLNGAQWVIIDGSNSGGSDRSLTLVNTGGSGYAAPLSLYHDGNVAASNIVVKNCILQAHREAVFNAQGFNMYSITGKAGYRNIVLDNNAINSAKYGVNITGTALGKAVNIRVTNNTIGSMDDVKAVMQFGVYMVNADSVLVEGNEVIGPALGNSTAVSSIMGFYAGPGITNLKISRNKIHDWYNLPKGSIGIYYEGDNTTTNEISNNVIHSIKSPGSNTSVTGGNTFGIFVWAGNGIRIYHNSVNLFDNYLTSTKNVMSSCLGFGNYLSGADVRNNILKNSSQPSSGTPSSKSYCITAGTNTVFATLNNNDYFTDGIGPVLGYYMGTDRVTLSDWQTATGQDANAVNVNPLYASDTDLYPNTTAIPNAGLYIPGVPTDIVNTMRSDPPDIGAYEFTSDPVVITTSASGIGFTTANLLGTITAANMIVNGFFDYGTTTTYGSTAGTSPATVTGNAPTPVTAGISGLLPNTTYHYRARGVTSGGLIAYGADKTFSTPIQPPTLITSLATGITSNASVLNGTVNPNGSAATTFFEWGLTTSYGNTVAGIPSSVTGSVMTPVNASISGLQPYTVYHYRVVATNAGGISYGNDMTFTTMAIAPAIVTNLATNVSSTSAQLNGLATAFNAPTTVTFQWGTTTNYGNSINATPGSVTGMNPTAVLANITGLAINTLYHFRCVGVNAGGTTYGLDQVFTTNCVAPVITIAGPATVCAASTGNVYTTQPGNSNYQWTVSSGGTITSGIGTEAITVTWNTTGAQTVSVNYQNSYGCSAITPPVFNVIVNALPTPTISGPQPVCQYSTGNVYSTQAGFSNYQWTVSPGGTIIAGAGTNSITVNWNIAGTQAVNVNYNTSNGCQAIVATAYSVTVNAAPVPTITGASSLCPGSGSYSYVTEAGMSGYAWSVSPGGTIISGLGTNMVMVSWNTPGAQTISVNYLNGNGCSAPAPAVMNITVNPLPGTAGAIAGTPTVCGGATGIAYSCSSITNTNYYVWTLPAGATIVSGAGTNYILVDFAPNASSGDITVYGNNLCGNGIISPAFPVSVTSIPGNPGTINGDTEVCKGTSGVVYSVQPIAGATTYTWSTPGGATIVGGINTNSITVNFGLNAVSGNITVSGSNSCGAGHTSTLPVTVNPIPQAPVISLNGSVLSSSVPTGNQWYHEGIPIMGATSQTYDAALSGSGWYWSKVTVNGCTSDTSNHVYVLVTGMNEINDLACRIYPVPTDGQFTVQLTTQKQSEISLEIRNTLGDLVMSWPKVTVGGFVAVQADIRHVAAGIYFVIIRNGDQAIVRKIVVAR